MTAPIEGAPSVEATATMPLSVAADLVAGHVDTLWNQVVNDEDMRGCCKRCCAPCNALSRLHDDGALDFLYGQYMAATGGESDVWDAANKQLDRSWFDGAWRDDLGCHDPLEGSRACGCAWVDDSPRWIRYTKRCPEHREMCRSLEPWELELSSRLEPIE